MTERIFTVRRLRDVTLSEGRFIGSFNATRNFVSTREKDCRSPFRHDIASGTELKRPQETENS